MLREFEGGQKRAAEICRTQGITAIVLGATLSVIVNKLSMPYYDDVRPARHTLPRVASLSAETQFDKTVLWMSFTLFVVSSLAQIGLS